MVSNRCKQAVKELIRSNGLHFVIVDLGVVEIMEEISVEIKNKLKIELFEIGLELMDDRKAMLVEKIKNVVIEMVHQDVLPEVNFSQYLSEKLHYDYTHLANLFSEMQGSTIEKFVLSNKVERIKELILYAEMNLNEISYKMNYSSAAHLSNQFKKVTGLSPTQFKNLKSNLRSPLEDLGLTTKPKSDA
jgi:YesN/AraC family two-component response regulator